MAVKGTLQHSLIQVGGWWAAAGWWLLGGWCTTKSVLFELVDGQRLNTAFPHAVLHAWMAMAHWPLHRLLLAFPLTANAVQQLLPLLTAAVVHPLHLVQAALQDGLRTVRDLHRKAEEIVTASVEALLEVGGACSKLRQDLSRHQAFMQLFTDLL